jgi:hypothetical protein
MKHSLLLAAALLLGGAALAQTKPNPQPNAPTGFDAQTNLNAIGGANGPGGSNTAVRTFDGRYEGVKNSPYLLDEWFRADLFLVNNSKYENVLLKLNTFADEVVIKRTGSGDSIIIDKPTVDYFVIKPNQEQVILFRKVQPKGEAKARYFQVLAQGDYLLLVRHSKELLRADFKGGYSAGRTYDEFVPERQYLVALPADKTNLIKVKPNDKAVLKALQDNGQWADYLKQQGLNLKAEADLVRFFNYLNKAQ